MPPSCISTGSAPWRCSSLWSPPTNECPNLFHAEGHERVLRLLHPTGRNQQLHGCCLSVPPACSSRPSRGRRPRVPLRRYPTPSCAACPGRAAPCYAVLLAALTGCRAALGARQAPQARWPLGGGL